MPTSSTQVAASPGSRRVRRRVQASPSNDAGPPAGASTGLSRGSGRARPRQSRARQLAFVAALRDASLSAGEAPTDVESDATVANAVDDDDTEQEESGDREAALAQHTFRVLATTSRMVALAEAVRLRSSSS